jgi:small GTP-binding protein
MGNCNKTEHNPGKSNKIRNNNELKIVRPTFTTNQNSSDDYYKLFKIILAGNSTVGKSSFTTRVTLNQFNLETKSTIGVEFTAKTIEVNGIKIKLQIWDTAGQERYRAVTNAYYRNAHAVILMYSITDMDSYNSLERWKSEIFQNVENPIVVLVGNKSDSEYKREVSQEKGIEFAKANEIYFFEVSALADLGCNQILDVIGQQLLAKKILTKKI